MLIILGEKLEKEYEKAKSIQSPKTFAKKNIKLNGKLYYQSSNFLEEYYSGSNIKKLILSIKKYKTYKKQHNKDELYLADLLK